MILSVIYHAWPICAGIMENAMTAWTLLFANVMTGSAGTIVVSAQMVTANLWRDIHTPWQLVQVAKSSYLVARESVAF